MFFHCFATRDIGLRLFVLSLHRRPLAFRSEAMRTSDAEPIPIAAQGLFH